jgi:hypothetical protein
MNNRYPRTCIVPIAEQCSGPSAFPCAAEAGATPKCLGRQVASAESVAVSLVADAEFLMMLGMFADLTARRPGPTGAGTGSGKKLIQQLIQS